MIDLNKKNIGDLSFIRNVIISVISYYGNNIKNVTIEDDNIVESYIPFGFSKNGDVQYIEDLYFDRELICDNTKINGMISSVPSGILSIDNISIDDSASLNTNVSAVYDSLKKGEWFDEYEKRFTRISVVPLVIECNMIIRAPNLISSLIISENLLDIHYKVRHTMCSFGGFSKIPISIMSGNNVGGKPKNVGIKMSDSSDKYITIDKRITLSTYYLIKNRVVDYNTEIKKTEINTKTN